MQGIQPYHSFLKSLKIYDDFLIFKISYVLSICDHSGHFLHATHVSYSIFERKQKQLCDTLQAPALVQPPVTEKCK